jgi:transcriptional regulator GlxA family with amidase domain
MTKPAHYIFALAEDFTHLAFACAVEPLRIANLVSRRELYRWSYASANGETATASNGTVSLVHHSFADIPPCDRLFVLSGVNIEKPGQTHGELITALRRADRQHGTKVGALCSGAWILARAGFLNGMKAATTRSHRRASPRTSGYPRGSWSGCSGNTSTPLRRSTSWKCASTGRGISCCRRRCR